MSRCTGRRCGTEMKIAQDPTGPYRFPPVQCKEECAADSDLCKTCIKWKAQYDAGKKDKWHGYIHGELPAESHIEGSEWNLKLRAKYAEKMAKAAMGESNAAPKAKKAAKKALEAVAEAKEARVEAVAALKEAETATNAVVAEVLRRSSSSSPRRVALGMAEMRFGSSSPKKTARKPRAKKTAARTMLGMAELYSSSSSSPKKTARKATTARKPRTKAAGPTMLGIAEMYSPSSSSASRKTGSNSMIYRPASASGSPLGSKNNAGYATPYSGSPASASASALAGVANVYTSSSSSKPSSNTGSNYSAGSNLLLQ
jgi:hypothetical protein